jgi:hypothetical protein
MEQTRLELNPRSATPGQDQGIEHFRAGPSRKGEAGSRYLAVTFDDQPLERCYKLA